MFIVVSQRPKLREQPPFQMLSAMEPEGKESSGESCPGNWMFEQEVTHATSAKNYSMATSNQREPGVHSSLSEGELEIVGTSKNDYQRARP